MGFQTALDPSQAAVSLERNTFRFSRGAILATVVLLEAGLVISDSLAGRQLFQIGSGRVVDPDTAVGIGMVAAVLCAVMGQVLGLYDFSKLLAPEVGRTAFASMTVVLLLTANLFVLKAGADVSRGYLLTFGAVLLMTLILARLALARVMSRCVAARLISGRQAVLIGTADELEGLPADDLFRHFGLTEVARVITPELESDTQAGLARSSAEAVRLARALQADEFVIASPWAHLDQLTRLEQELRMSPLPVRLLPDGSARNLMARHGSRRAHVLVDLQRAPVGPLGRVAKRTLDVTMAAAALVVFLPLLVATAIAVHLDSPGPVLFRQRRNGFDQRTFLILKFRTMTVMEDQDTVVQARRDDDRVTRIGRILRRTSIDELPQLLNVLRGDMAMVGPRPHALAHDRHFGQEIDDYCVRHHVKPGITGWAQVNGLRGETRDAVQMQRRVEHDLWYIDNWSIALDLHILLRTCREVLVHDAY